MRTIPQNIVGPFVVTMLCASGPVRAADAQPDVKAGVATPPYAESYGTARALIKRHGLPSVRRSQESLSVTPDFSEAVVSGVPQWYRNFHVAWVTADVGARF
ncbi:MAG: hypothetical protein ACKOBZ_08095 [Nitrospira sp.]